MFGISSRIALIGGPIFECCSHGLKGAYPEKLQELAGNGKLL